MCNINIIYNLTGAKSDKLAACMNVVSYNSFKSNRDAEGHYCENFNVATSEEKQIFKGKHSFIVAHERLSTSGKNAEMAQPLESDNFIITHNGIFYGLGTADHSDTWEYLQQLETEYAKVKTTKKAVANLNKRTSGYYSVVLYNKKTKEHLYYKHNASMYILKQNDYLLMSTSQENVEYMRRYFSLSDDILEVKEGIFFDLSRGMKPCGKFEPYVYVPPKKTSYGGQTAVQSNYGSGYYLKRSEIDEIKDALFLIGIKDATVGRHRDEFCIGLITKEDVLLVETTFTSSVVSSIKSTRKYLVNLDADEALKEARLLEMYYNAV